MFNKKCKFIKHCNCYNPNGLCDTNGAEGFYEWGRHAGCYRSLLNEGKESRYWKD